MNSQGKFDVRAVVGSGTLYVTRDAGFEIGLFKEPYRGSVPIISGEIGEDLAYYLAKSEQVNSALGIGVLMTVDQSGEEDLKPEFSLERLRVSAAGGLMIQVMPGAEESLISRVERHFENAPHSTEMIRAGFSPIDMLETVVGDLELNVLEEREPRFACRCSRERALLIVSALGRDEVEDMLEKDNGAELTCHFCNELYELSGHDLKTVLSQA
jgi:molecular chaperone Hsp33